MLTQGFPRLRIAEGGIDRDGKPTTPGLAQAWETADLYLSGSGSGFPYHTHAAAFRRLTGKPLGIFGVSTDPISGVTAGREPEGGTLNELRAKAAQLPSNHLSGVLRYAIDEAAFMFCRDTISRDYLRTQKLKTPILEFGPDAQLGMHLRDDVKGLGYLHAHGLIAGKFICVIPRYRYTPVYLVRPDLGRGASDDLRDAINLRTTEKDHAKLRETIIAFVRGTGERVLVCPEMTYQVELGKRVLVDPLPADVKKNVVWRDRYWMPDEAASVYRKALAVISLECHSPLIALHNGTPTFYVRQPTDTCKGQMYRDLGLEEWFFEVDETSGPELWSRLHAIYKDPAAARMKAAAAMERVETLQRRMVDVVRSTVVGAIQAGSVR